MAKLSVLFVCMGNICRSPSAEGVFLNLLQDHPMAEHLHVDSAGTHGYHIGDPADPRSTQHAAKRGVDITPHRARRVELADFETYDYILAMDDNNMDALMAVCPEEHRAKVVLFLTYAPHLGEAHVPDPYYGGNQGFEHVLDLCEAAAQGLLSHLEDRLAQAQCGGLSKPPEVC